MNKLIFLLVACIELVAVAVTLKGYNTPPITSKFTAKYTVSVERIILDYVNESYWSVNLSVKKINRLQTAINGNTTGHFNLTADYLINFKLYALFSNEYRLMPMDYKSDICTGMNFIKDMWEKQIEPYSNFKARCPILEGHYWIKDLVMSNEGFYPLPWDKVMAVANLTHKLGDTLLDLRIYATTSHSEYFVNSFLNDTTK